MKRTRHIGVFPLAIAIFSMFFGAGNTIFPLLLGVEAKSRFGSAFLGLLLTSVGGPLLGLVTALLFQGKAKDFFSRFGKVIGMILLGSSLALLGPLAVLPRCITVAHAAITPIFPGVSLGIFALVFALLCLLCCYKESSLLSILGYVLSPLLLGCLLIIILKGGLSGQTLAVSPLAGKEAFRHGILTGYHTMDLIAAIFFSSGIWNMIAMRKQTTPASTVKVTLRAGILACALLGLVYFGLGYTAALYAPSLEGVPPEQLICHLALLTLGPIGAQVANAAVALACLTTVISLTMTISELLAQELLPKRIAYKKGCFFILALAASLSLIGFERIMAVIHAVVVVCYPIIIVLTLVNSFYKFRELSRNKGAKDVRSPISPENG